MPEDIYQQIWDADMNEGCGVRAYVTNTELTEEQKNAGYVMVDEDADGTVPNNQLKNLRLLPDASIPATKKTSYDRVRALFDNYVLDQTKTDDILPEETGEIQQFLEWAIAQPSHRVARDYYASQTGTTPTDDAWWAIIERLWFERFDMGKNRNLSAFEHVIVGEQKQGTVQGYHFWYKYFVDERFEIPHTEGKIQDLISIIGFENEASDVTPDVATLQFKWDAPDYKASMEQGKFVTRPLTKPKGGFFIGPSAEAILAMGTIAYLPEVHAPREATINGFRYQMKTFGGATPRNMRTFYPEFKGAAS